MTDPAKETLPVWLVAFTDSRSRGVDWGGAIMASSTLITIPVIIFFLVVQRRMVSGITRAR